MKRLIWGAVVAVLFVLASNVRVSASVDDFSFSSMTADYYLAKDSEGRSTLKVIEKLVAEFPAHDQNHGIERAIPEKYDGRPVSLKMQSITDGSGKAIDFSTYDSGEHTVFRIGDPDKYVHGSQVYELTYTLRDVTKAYQDTKSDEFYWDINGVLWRQPFGSVTARLHVDQALLPALTGSMSCYWGAQGSTNRCDIARKGNIITASVGSLSAGQNMTIAVAFKPDTFMSYQPSLLDILFRVWIGLLIVTTIIGLALLFWLAYRYQRLSNRSRELDPIATEYVPPQDYSVLVASQIGKDTKADTTAQLIDLAVRHYLTIAQTKEKSPWRQAEYELTIVKSTETLKSEEKVFLETLFGGTAVGTKLQTKSLKNSYTVGSKLRKNATELTKVIKSDYGLRHEDKAVSRYFKKIGVIATVISIILVSPMLLIAGLVAIGCGVSIHPLTNKGLELRRYMAGLKIYIELAETERIKALQSPEAATKTGVQVKGENDKKLVKLYERTLPYAILFGQEKQWNEQLAVRYENANATPDWYVGTSAFNAAMFTSVLNDFSSSMNSYGASSSSSSGGSSGGGSSGGGGGGGGGGGW